MSWVSPHLFRFREELFSWKTRRKLLRRKDTRVKHLRLSFESLEDRLAPSITGTAFQDFNGNYTDLEGTLASWGRVLRPGGKVFINSGNVRNPNAKAGEWILDETVYVVTEVATGLVRTDPRYAAYRDVVDDSERMARHLGFRDRVFLAPRPLSFYTGELETSGFEVRDVTEATITADVDEWFEFLKTYHEAVLGWVGGSVKVEGQAPSEQAVADRLALIRHAMDVIFGGRKTFRCCWTYVRAVWP